MFCLHPKILGSRNELGGMLNVSALTPKSQIIVLHVNLLSGREGDKRIRMCVCEGGGGIYLSISMQIHAGASLRYPIRLSPQQGV